jgi:hypothetical protein
MVLTERNSRAAISLLDSPDAASTTRCHKFVGNEYVTHSCGCPDGVPVLLWIGVEVEKLGKHSQCKLLPVAPLQEARRRVLRRDPRRKV